MCSDILPAILNFKMLFIRLYNKLRHNRKLFSFSMLPTDISAAFMFAVEFKVDTAGLNAI
jgi:hypothetical protein